jgi:hypothetical protein
MTGRAPHNADGTQRTETTKGTDPTTVSQQSTKGEMNKIEVPGQPMFGTEESLGEHCENILCLAQLWRLALRRALC